jgi:putative two-component system response regulator
MRLHTTMGATLLAEGNSEVIRLAETIASSHHERWDGKGYPAGLKGEEIALEGRIVAVVDVLDALTHERPYKDAWTLEDALREIQSQSGSHFDPQVVEALAALPAQTLLCMDMHEASHNGSSNSLSLS